MASPAAVSAVPVPSPTMPTAGSWPIEAPERRHHRIKFYQRFGVCLDPASPLSFAEQVRNAEGNITGNGRRRLVIRNKMYETLVSKVGKGYSYFNYSIQQISTPGAAGSNSTTETVLMRPTKGGAVRVLHSCNAFDVMADLHYKYHVANSPVSLRYHTQALRREVSISDADATVFVKLCPICCPSSNARHSIVPTVATSNVGGATSSVTLVPPNPVTPAVAMAAVPPAPRVISVIDLTVPIFESPYERKRRMEWEEREVADRLSRRFARHVGEWVDQIQRDDDSSTIDTVRSLPVHGLYNSVYRMLLKQLEFRKAGVPTKIDLGYHYTKQENMMYIRKSGLRVPSELHHTVSRNGAVYGQGIYTASNPLAFHGKYGEAGLLVARLMGTNADYTHTSHGHSNSGTVGRDKLDEIVVASKSDQIVALLEFKASQIAPNLFTHSGNLRLARHHVKLQDLLDSVINDPHDNGQATPRNVRPKHSHNATVNQGSVQNQAIPLFAPETLHYMAPISFIGQTHGLVGQLAVPAPFRDTWTCTLCHQACTSSHISQIKACQHAFHRGCLDRALGTNPSCPTCHTLLGPPQGKMPSGTMIMSRSTSACSGYVHASTICIEYKIPQSRQHLYHPHPGVDHDSVNRRAYLPETSEGCNVLKRLKFAFLHGLSFTVGVSQTTGRDNSVTWSSIPHKTVLSGGPARFGFPDPNYFATCNAELDTLHVPKASDL